MCPRNFKHSVPHVTAKGRMGEWTSGQLGLRSHSPLAHSPPHPLTLSLASFLNRTDNTVAFQFQSSKANMNRRTLLVFIFLLSLSFMNLPSNAQKSVAPDLIITNAVIHTMDPVQPISEAVAIYGNRIVAVGSSKDIKKLAASNTRVIDAKKRL